MKFKIMTLNKLIVQVVLLIGILTFNSCKDEVIQLQGTEASNYIIPEAMGVIVGQDGKSAMSNFDFHQEGKFKFTVKLNKSLNQDAAVKLSYDESVLQSYNSKNGTNYIAYPKELITIPNNGDLSIASKTNISNTIEITLKANTSATPDDVFVLPIKASSNAFEGANSVDYILFVKDLTKGASAAKENGLKVFSIIEANNVNPLMHLAFNLKNSGKPLFDHVVLFSSNINFDEKTGKVYISHNENLTHILQNREKYIKPLQDRGIKVSLSLLGNHDKSGIANLSDKAIKYFAREIKNTCDAYGLDGVFYDDEYSDYTYPPPVGFEYPSSSRVAKLMYEVKKLMPHRDNMAYVYSTTGNFGESFWGNNGIEEAKAGEYVDYAIHDYYNDFDLTDNFPGLDKGGWIMLSSEFARNYYPGIISLRSIREKKQGGTMVFSLNPHNSNFEWGQLPHMNDIAKAFYDDEVTYDASKSLAKDW